MYRIVSILILFIFSVESFATHNRAGEITYKHINGLKYEVTVTTYTDVGHDVSADRPTLEVLWGDGQKSVLPRVNGPGGTGQLIGNETKVNIYVGQHTYPGPGTYLVSMEDPNRNEGVINLPNSVNQTFYIESTIVISPFGANNYNSSPVLLNPPLDNACVSRLYVHNPGAYDPDGDSLSYKLVNCKGISGAEILGYSIPSNVSLNSVTGDLTWNTPTMVGEFNYAILIEEWRKYSNTYVKIGSVLRDLQVIVGTCPFNNPPVISTNIDTCVVANDLLTFKVNATDPDGNYIYLSGFGGPLQITNSPAQFPSTSGFSPVSSTFNWQTNCDHVRLQPYSVLFKVIDNGSPSLTGYKTANIKVLGPAVQNLQANPQGNSINISWDKSICNQVLGYNVYRKNSFYGYVPSYCETGVPSYTGYQQIDYVNGYTNTVYIDNNKGTGLIPGVQYCYIIVAIFPDGSESVASIEVCSSLKKDIPVITNVDVKSTSESQGEIFLAWSKPIELDTNLHLGPYKYLIYHSQDSLGASFSLIDSTDVIKGLNDTLFSHLNIDTKTKSHSYRIDLYNVDLQNRYFIGNSHFAPSIYLNVSPVSSGGELLLSWNNNTPWLNTRFVIYKQNQQTLNFDSLTVTTSTSFVDINLDNGKEYCYLIKSEGAYLVSGFVNPIINYSQENCGIPEDNNPPCPPVLAIEPDCFSINNSLKWNNPNNSCVNKDAGAYGIYYKPTSLGVFVKIKDVNSVTDTTFSHSKNGSIAGCYYVSAIDTFGNESLLLDSVCIDNCPLYELPNVFSPDGDGKNDYFKPIMPYRYIESIDIKIFNRWGAIVFSTANPDINWNGVDESSNKPCSEGVYFYVCKVNEIRLTGIETHELRGSIQLFRNADIIPKSQ